jgi:FkbM family methyltransferase
MPDFIKKFKKIIKRTFNIFGFELISKNNPYFNLINSPFMSLKGEIFKTIFDIGANKGQFLEKAVNHFKSANFYCFEPLKDPFDILQKYSNTHGNVKVLNYALGNEIGYSNIHCHLDHDESSSFLETTKICKEYYPFVEKQLDKKVFMTTLDDFYSKITPKPEPEILIKIDVQGYELEVLRGAIDTLINSKAIIIEINFDKLYQNQASFEDILFFLHDKGFKLKGFLEPIYSKDMHLIFSDFIFYNSK